MFPLGMNTTEIRASAGLAIIFFLRMLGLFLILPVFVLYAQDLTDATPILIGIAFGIYGLTQALFQIPFGMLSDRIGRKPVITIGLIIFALGSVIAGSSDSIWIVICGRILQGSGAIAAAVMALAADLTHESQRTKAMAIIGMSIGIAFALAFVIGPMLTPTIGVPGLFYLAAVLACIALIILFSIVPTPTSLEFHEESEASLQKLNNVLCNKKLVPLYLGIFTLHMLLMSSFLVIPVTLRDVAGLATGQHWHVYLPVFIISVVFMFPFIIFGEKYKKVKYFFEGAILLMILSQTGFFMAHDSIRQIFIMLVIFFTAFNYLEATLPSLITKQADPSQKGIALGIYSSSQFMGTFAGGLAGGYCFDRFDINGVFLLGAVISVCWLVFTFSMPPLTKGN